MWVGKGKLGLPTTQTVEIHAELKSALSAFRFPATEQNYIIIIIRAEIKAKLCLSVKLLTTLVSSTYPPERQFFFFPTNPLKLVIPL